MPTQINGLPAHVLLIHVVIIFVPLAAVMLVVSAVWPLARRKLGVLTPLVALVALVAVPVTTHAGEWLRDHLPRQVAESAAVRKHTEIGDDLLPWAIGLFLLAALLWFAGRRYDIGWRRSVTPVPTTRERVAAGGGGGAVATEPQAQPVVAAATRPAMPVWAVAIFAVLAIAVSVGSVVELYKIGDAGAKAVWSGVATSQSNGSGGN